MDARRIHLVQHLDRARRLSHRGPQAGSLPHVLEYRATDVATVLGEVSVLTIVNAGKEFLPPLLVLPSLMMAGMIISVLVPVTLVPVFQRQFLRDAGRAEAIKG